MKIEGMVKTVSKSAWAVTPTKDSQIKVLKSYTHLSVIRRKSIKFKMNPMKDVEGVADVERCRRSYRDNISDLQSICQHGQ